MPNKYNENSTKTESVKLKFINFTTDFKWLIIAFIWAISFVFCFIGVYKQLALTDKLFSISEVIYRTLQLYVFEDNFLGFGKIKAWELEIGRFLAPSVTVLAVFSVIINMFNSQIHIFKLRILKKHVVICGAGRKGIDLVRDFRNKAYQVVVIEENDSSSIISLCKELGAFVITGNATESEILKRARVEYAEKLIAITGNDADNIEIAVKTYSFVKNRSNKLSYSVHCYIHIVNSKLRLLFDKHPVFTDIYDDYEISIFNTFANSSRQLFSRFPIDGKGISLNSSDQVQLFILGCGKMGESILIQAARIAHYANRKKVSITVIDQFAESKSKIMLSRYPMLAQICNLNFIQADAEEKLIISFINEQCSNNNTINHIIIAFDDDAKSLSMALHYRYHLNDSEIPIIARMAEKSGLASLLKTNINNTNWISNIYAFGYSSESYNLELLQNDKQNLFARLIHENYVKQRQKEDIYHKNLNLVDWEKLNPDLKDSNIFQADHIMIKLRAIGCNVVEKAHKINNFNGFTEQEIEVMAIMEHERWIAERYLAGWKLGEKDTDNRISPYLTAWENLPNDIQNYNKESVVEIPKILEMAGEKIIRIY